MMNHTPGPWKYFPHDPEISITGYAIETEDALEIAVTAFGLGPQEDKANARLIASAPVMLEALRHLLEEALQTNENEHAWFYVSDDAVIQARTAIAQATAQD